MKTTQHSKLLSATLLGVIASTTAWSPAATAGGHTGVAVIGGLLAGHVLTNFADRDKQRTADMNSMAYNQQRASAAPSGGGSSSPEARIKQLDKLAAGGYITPAEYKTKKKAILDSM